MFKYIKFTLIPLLTILYFPQSLEASPVPDVFSQLDYIPNELLIKFTASGESSKNKAKTAKQKASQHKVTHRHQYSHLNVERWQLDKSENLQTTLRKLKGDPDVLMVEPNYRRYPRGERFVNASTAMTMSNDNLSQIRLDELRLLSAFPVIKEPVIAIIDDAFDLTHPDLTNKVFSPYDALDSTVLNVDSDPTPTFCTDSSTGDVIDETHGTRVMGVLAGNGTGVNGASETRNIIPIRIGCNYSVGAELAAINWAIEKNANIINMSYGGPQFSAFERDALFLLATKNTLVIAAAGNSEISNDLVLDFPSGLDLPNIIAVAALEPDNTLTSWSQYGQTRVDIAALGGSDNVATTFPDNRYVQTSGTSFSAPFVAGVAASLMARHPSANENDVKAAILASAVPFSNNLKARLTTDGFIDAMAAHDLLTQTAKPLLLIKQVTIDDAGVGNDVGNKKGNQNARVDKGEQVEIVVIVENSWADADTLTSVLTSADLNLSAITRQTGLLTGYDSTRFRNGSIALRFPVDFSAQMQMQDLTFTLDFSGTYESGTKNFSYQRSFTVDTGSLIAGEPVEARLKTHDQDETHTYSFYLSESMADKKGSLVFNLLMRGKKITDNLNLLVKQGAVPQFDFIAYETEFNDQEKPDIAEAIDSGTFVSANVGLLPEQIIFRNAVAGTYHIIVVSSPIISAENIAYKLSADFQIYPPAKKHHSGCSIALGGLGGFGGVSETVSFDKIDPLLPLFVFLSLVGLFMNRKKTKSDLKNV